jgi:hypothetical protein
MGHVLSSSICAALIYVFILAFIFIVIITIVRSSSSSVSEVSPSVVMLA